MSKLSISWYFVLLAAAALYFVGVQSVMHLPRQEIDEEMTVVLPRGVQLAMSGGDRYLAANAATIRIMVSSLQKMTPERYKVQARIQSDAAWFNPANEDNYYQAAAFLPWNGQVAASQDILARAVAARPFDIYPAFFNAFNTFYFEKRPLEAAALLRKAAQATKNVEEQLLLDSLAARWSEKSSDLDVVIDTVRAMAADAKQSSFRKYLVQRVERLEGLRLLRKAASAYQASTSKPPTSLDDLVTAGLIAAVPVDPFGFGYGVDQTGVPVLFNSEKHK